MSHLLFVAMAFAFSIFLIAAGIWIFTDATLHQDGPQRIDVRWGTLAVFAGIGFLVMNIIGVVTT